MRGRISVTSSCNRWTIRIVPPTPRRRPNIASKTPNGGSPSRPTSSSGSASAVILRPEFVARRSWALWPTSLLAPAQAAKFLALGAGQPCIRCMLNRRPENPSLPSKRGFHGFLAFGDQLCRHGGGDFRVRLPVRGLKDRYDLVHVRAGSFLKLFLGGPDIDEAGESFARLQTQPLLDGRVIGVPLGDPVGDKTKRRRCDQDVLAHGAGGKFLLPDRNLVLFAGGRYDPDHHRRAQKAAALFLHLLVALAFGLHHLGQDVAGALAPLGLEHNEPPGKQLAMIGRARTGL